MITICEERNNSMFKYRANISTLEGKNVHLVLPQVENFLLKLDMAQREMGKDPANFVPLKYGMADQDEQASTANLLLGGIFLLGLVKLYRSMHGKSGGAQSKKGTGG